MNADTREARSAAFLRTYAERLRNGTAATWEIPNTVATTLEDVATLVSVLQAEILALQDQLRKWEDGEDLRAERCSAHPADPLVLVCEHCYESQQTAALKARLAAAEAQVEQLIGDVHAITGDYTAAKAQVTALTATIQELREELAKAKDADGLVKIQKHRDQWRGYAYGKRPKPDDFLDGNLVDRPLTLIDTLTEEVVAAREALAFNGARAVAAEAQVSALRGQLAAAEGLIAQWQEHAKERRLLASVQGFSHQEPPPLVKHLRTVASVLDQCADELALVLRETRTAQTDADGKAQR